MCKGKKDDTQKQRLVQREPEFFVGGSSEKNTWEESPYGDEGGGRKSKTERL